MAKRKRQVQIQVDVQTAKAVRALRRFGGTQDRTFRSMRRALDKTLGKWKRQKDAIVSLDASLNLLGRSFSGLSAVLESTLTASAEQQSGINQLNRSFDQLGLNVPEATSALEAFAAQQQRTTRFGDDQTRSIAANLGQLLTGTETSVDEIIALTSLVQDTVEATGKGAEEVARQLAQVYSGNVEAIGELLPSQREAVNAIKESEGAAAAAAAAFELLNTAFGGAAEAIDPFDQQVANLRNTFGDLLESIGDQARRSLEESGALTGIQETLESIIYWVETNGDTITNWVDELADAFRAAYDAAKFILDTLNDIVQARARNRAEERSAAVSDALFEREQSNMNARIELEEKLGIARNANLDLARDAVAVSRGEMRFTLAHRDAGFENMEAFQDYGNAISNAAAMADVNIRQTIRRLENLREAHQRIQRDRDALSESLSSPEEFIEFEGMEFTAGGGGGGIDPDVFDDPDVIRRPIEQERWVQQTGFDAAREWWDGFVDGFEDHLSEARERIALILDTGEAILAKEALSQKGADIGSTLAEGVTDGLSIATSAVRGFTSAIPALMQEGAESGVARFGAVMQLLGVAASTAAAVGVATKTATSWAPLLSEFFALSAASAAFASALGAGGGGGGAPPRRGATGIDTGDVLTGVRPEAARTGQARVINLNIGTVMNNDQTRRAIAASVTESEMLGELRRAG